MSREDIGWLFLGVAIMLAIKWLVRKVGGQA